MNPLKPEPTVHENVELSNCRLGAWTEVGAYSWLENVQLGDYSYTGPMGFFQNTDIGKFANIAANVRVGPTMHPMDRPTLHHFTYRRRAYGLAERDDEDFFAWRAAQVATIGHDTWIGHGAIVMPGVVVGDGAVVGSGAVVTKDVPPYTVVVGVPARVIRERFDPATADALQRMKWWDWTHEQLKHRLADFSGPVEAFIEKWGRT
jgi:phosphonate metabolism protein (transferase hexapeptide repeat family)